MKKVRAIVAALAAVFTMGLVASTGCGNLVSYDRYENAELYSVGTASVSAESVEKIEIDWVGGGIEVEQTASKTLQVIEERSSEKDAERMHYYLDGKVLKIKYCESGLRGTVNERNKNLFVEIPAGISLEIDSVSAGITMGVLNVNALSIESVSGNVTAERIVSEETEVETVSGKVSVGELITSKLSLDGVSGGVEITRLSTDFLEMEMVSGDVSLGVQKALSAEIESVSADVTITLREGLGATIEMKTTSGKFSTKKEFGETGSRYDVFGEDGVSVDCSFKIETTSGDVIVR